MDIIIDDDLYNRFNELENIIEYGEDADNDSIDDVKLSIYNKEDIMILLKCESDKALRFLKLMFQMQYAIKIGKEYYIKRDDFERFFNDFKGKAIAI